MSKKAWLQTCPTLPETNIFAPPQKMDGWNTIVNFLLGCHIFQGLFAVRCGECTHFFWLPDSSFDAKNRWFLFGGKNHRWRLVYLHAFGRCLQLRQGHQ